MKREPRFTEGLTAFHDPVLLIIPAVSQRDRDGIVSVPQILADGIDVIVGPVGERPFHRV